MTLNDLKKVWGSNKIIKVYTWHIGECEDLFIGSLDELEDETILNKEIDGIYDYSGLDDVDLEIAVF